MTIGRKPAFDREAVLRSAMELFWERGYERTGMTELLAHLGIGRQSLYNTFGSKRELFLEALELYANSVGGWVVDTLQQPGSPRDRLLEVLGELENWAGQEGHVGCLFCNTMAEFGGDDPEASAIIDRTFARQEEAYYRAILAGQDRGEFSGELDARDLARTVITTSRGLSLLRRHGKGNRDVARSVVGQVRKLLAAA